MSELTHGEDPISERSTNAVFPTDLFIKIAVSSLLALLLVVFLLQNAHPVRVTLFVWSTALPLSLFLFFAAIVGILLGVTLCGLYVWKSASKS